MSKVFFVIGVLLVVIALGGMLYGNREFSRSEDYLESYKEIYLEEKIDIDDLLEDIILDEVNLDDLMEEALIEGDANESNGQGDGADSMKDKKEEVKDSNDEAEPVLEIARGYKLKELVELFNADLYFSDIDYTTGNLSKPQEGYRFTKVNLLVRNRFDTIKQVSGLVGFSIVMEDGSEHKSKLVTDNRSPFGGVLLPGDIIRGDIYFETPAELRAVKLKYDFLPLFKGILEIDLEQSLDDVAPLPMPSYPLYGLTDDLTFDRAIYRVDSITTTKTNGIFTAREGYTYLIVDITIENLTEDLYPVSTIMNFALQDFDGNTYNTTLFSELKDELNFNVGAKSTRSGQIAFMVKEGLSYKLVIIDRPNVFSVQFQTVLIQID